MLVGQVLFLKAHRSRALAFLCDCLRPCGAGHRSMISILSGKSSSFLLVVFLVSSSSPLLRSLFVHLQSSVAGMAVNRLEDPGFLDGSTKSRSFLNALSGVSPTVTFPELKSTTCRGLPSLWISKEKILTLAAPLEFALVGKFPTRRPSLNVIRKFFFYLKLIGEFSVTLLNPSHVLIKLVNDLDYNRVFSHRSYFVNSC